MHASIRYLLVYRTGCDISLSILKFRKRRRRTPGRWVDVDRIFNAARFLGKMINIRDRRGRI